MNWKNNSGTETYCFIWNYNNEPLSSVLSDINHQLDPTSQLEQNRIEIISDIFEVLIWRSGVGPLYDEEPVSTDESSSLYIHN